MQCEVPLPIEYGSKRIETGYRLDLVVERRLIVELKAVLSLEPIHLAQLLTYLRLARAPLGLLINFNVLLLKDGIRRVIHTPAPP